MILYILGSGTPVPTKERYGSAYVLQLGDDCLMFDCGPATTHKLVKAGLFPTQVDHLFFTHHHYDHNVDYPCFLLCRWDQSTGRENRLHVWGPPPTEWITDRLIGPDGAFSHDWKARVGHPASQSVHALRGGSLPRPAPSLDVHDVGPGVVARGERWAVTAARARHVEPWLESLAYRVDADRASIVFAGDTAPCESVSKLARGVDVLVISCWDRQDAMDKDAAQIAAVIAGPLDVATMAQECGVKRLIVTHTQPNISRPGAREKVIGDIARVYGGEIVFAQELMTLALDRSCHQADSS
jgi:ribonuclease BN (tRNA processing enzyme)